MTVVSYKNVKRAIIPVGDLPTLALFARGEQGAWYDPSDLYNYLQSGPPTMFQDAGGTIPVTSVEQPVGLIRDKSGNGNHASQLTAPARPTLSARVNTLSNSRSASAGALSNAIAVVQPERGFKLVESSGKSRGLLAILGGVSAGNTITVWARAGEWNRLGLGVSNTSGLWSIARFNLETGQYEGRTDYATDLVTNASIVRDGDFWKCSVTRDVGSSSNFAIMPFGQAGDPINPTPAMVGDGVSGIYIDRMQAEHSPAPTRYQDSRSSTDYDWWGWPLHLRFDGVDDRLSVSNPRAFDFTLQSGCFIGMRLMAEASFWCGTGSAGNAGIAGVRFGRASTALDYRLSVSNGAGVYASGMNDVIGSHVPATLIAGHKAHPTNPVRFGGANKRHRVISSAVANWSDTSDTPVAFPLAIPAFGATSSPGWVSGLIVVEDSDPVAFADKNFEMIRAQLEKTPA